MITFAVLAVGIVVSALTVVLLAFLGRTHPHF